MKTNEVDNVLKGLRKEFKWNFTIKNKILTLRRIFNKRFITFNLTFKPEGVQLTHPKYNFTNKISHFKSIEEEQRLSLNKHDLIAVIKLLKRMGLWGKIINKNFLELNNQNKNLNINHSKKKLIEQQLKDLLA